MRVRGQPWMLQSSQGTLTSLEQPGRGADFSMDAYRVAEIARGWRRGKSCVLEAWGWGRWSEAEVSSRLWSMWHCVFTVTGNSEIFHVYLYTGSSQTLSKWTLLSHSAMQKLKPRDAKTSQGFRVTTQTWKPVLRVFTLFLKLFLFYVHEFLPTCMYIHYVYLII